MWSLKSIVFFTCTFTDCSNFFYFFYWLLIKIFLKYHSWLPFTTFYCVIEKYFKKMHEGGSNENRYTELNDVVYFKNNIQSYTSTCPTVSLSGEYPSHKSPLRSEPVLNIVHEFCCPNKYGDPSMPFSADQWCESHIAILLGYQNFANMFCIRMTLCGHSTFCKHGWITADCLLDDTVGYPPAHIMCFCMTTLGKFISVGGITFLTYFTSTQSCCHIHRKINKIITKVIFLFDPSLCIYYYGKSTKSGLS